MSTLLFNPYDPAFYADPYGHYRRLREEDPVHRSPFGTWVVSRYEAVRQVLTDARFLVADVPAKVARKSEILRLQQEGTDLGDLLRGTRHWLSFIEPPDHTRIRRLVGAAFSKRSTESLRQSVRQCAQGLIEQMRSHDTLDLMSDFARLLPSHVISRVLGVPEETIPRMLTLTEQVSRILDPLLSLAQYTELDAAAAEFSHLLRELVQRRRAVPQDDLLSALVQASDNEAALSDDELVSTCVLLFCAGSETTVNLIGNGMLALMKRPAKQRELRDNPQQMPAAVEEMLRFDPPLQMTSRVAAEDVVLGGQQMRAGDQVYLLVGSANRDPAEFAEPDTLEFDRPRNRHLAFAAGHHLCLGASLARIELQESFAALLSMLPEIEIAEPELHWRPHVVLRGLERLSVRIGQIQSAAAVPAISAAG